MFARMVILAVDSRTVGLECDRACRRAPTSANERREGGFEMFWTAFWITAVLVVLMFLVAWLLDTIAQGMGDDRDLIRRNRWRDGRRS